jgi:CRISPR/Cas system CMR subunit Cmr6 (Cas7 group RAMP superfamily)
MILNLKKTDDDKTKADILEKHFSSVFTEEPGGEIPNPNPINIKEKCRN